MTPSTLSLLDQAELRQLALNASAANDDGAAISYLKEAVSRSDADGSAHYLLGAHYAQIKMYDRAVGEMEAALALDPGLSIARVQLGLLWLSSGYAAQSLTVLAPLQELADDDALRLFGQGLYHLANDELPAASASLAKGIELNLTNAALNADMQMIVDDIGKAIAAGPAPATGALPAATPDTVAVEDSAYHRHLLISAYAGTDDK